MASIGGAGTFDGIFLIGIVAVLIASLSHMEQAMRSMTIKCSLLP